MHDAKQTFKCIVTGVANRECKFTIVEGATGGTIDDKGLYTPPAQDGTFHVTATSTADPTLTKTATVRVVAPGAAGVWTNVTPAGISLDFNNPANNFGVQDVLVDPVRPSDVYAFVCYQGVWRSKDFGQTWAKVSEPGSLLETGRPWAAGIDSSVTRDPNTPPALYTVNGYGGAQGLFRSNDWGVTWKRFQLPEKYGQDAYSIDVDPNDGKHLLVGFHEGPGIIETTDGGESWKPITVPAAAGISLYGFFVHSADAATTRKTWIMISQATNGSAGTWRTEDAGDSWQLVETFEHGHGASQVYQPTAGTLYVGAAYGRAGMGVYRSTDFAKTWQMVGQMTETTVIGTPNYIYASNSQGWGPGYAGLARASSKGTDWTPITDPPGLTDGAKRSVVTYDGTHYVVISGNWGAGLWRYVEP